MVVIPKIMLVSRKYSTKSERYSVGGSILLPESAVAIKLSSLFRRSTRSIREVRFYLVSNPGKMS